MDQQRPSYDPFGYYRRPAKCMENPWWVKALCVLLALAIVVTVILLFALTASHSSDEGY